MSLPIFCSPSLAAPVDGFQRHAAAVTPRRQMARGWIANNAARLGPSQPLVLLFAAAAAGISTSPQWPPQTGDISFTGLQTIQSILSAALSDHGELSRSCFIGVIFFVFLRC